MPLTAKRREVATRAAASARSTSTKEHADRTTRRVRALESEVSRLNDMVDVLTRLVGDALSSSDGNAYDRDVRAVRVLIDSTLPAGATFAVISKGDDRLLLSGGRNGWHFPRNLEGRYAGYYPGDGLAAIAHLEYVRSCGAQWLVVPNAARWWFGEYTEFERHLETHYLLAADDAVARIYDVRARLDPERSPRARLDGLLRDLEDATDQTPSVLDLTGWDIAADVNHGIAIEASPSAGRMPYLDDTIDVVVTCCDSALVDEARRVARRAVVTLASGDLDSPPGTDARIERLNSISALPSASVVIPTYNGANLVDACMRAILETVPRSFDVEIIVADDCSTDDTRAVVAHWSGCDDRVRLVANRVNRGFLDNCNAAAESAEGDVLVLLNNDTVPLDGWLTALLRTIAHQPNVGVVGGKLLFPDGRLQEAGGALFKDASGANIGKWDPSPLRPLYCAAREADYCSGALLATPLPLWRKLGGFDTAFRPAYYEDADYCFRVRDAGYRVLYQPESVAVHIEGATSGTNLDTGVKRAQVVNRQKFLKKWGDALAERPSPPDRYDTATWFALTRRTAITS